MRIKFVFLLVSGVYVSLEFPLLCPLITVWTGNYLFLLVGFYIVFALLVVFSLASKFWPETEFLIFSKLTKCERARTWLTLHALFTNVSSSFYPIIGVVSSFAPLFVPAISDQFPIVFMLTWMTVFLDIIALWFCHMVLGMGYNWFCKGTGIGISSLSFAASKELQSRKPAGIRHLLQALLWLRDCLGREQLNLRTIDETIKVARCLLLFKEKIPYSDLLAISKELNKYPKIEEFPRTLVSFNAQTSVQWAHSFGTAERNRRTPLEYIIAVATILTALTFVPEAARNTLFGILQSLGSPGNVMIIIGAFFISIIVYLSNRDEPYHLSLWESKVKCL